MKQISFSPVVVATAILVCITGCKSKQNLRCVESVTVNDAIGLSQKGSNIVPVDIIGYDSIEFGTTCRIRLDFPKGNDSIANGIKNFFAQELASLYLPRNNEDVEDANMLREYPTYSGDVSDGTQMVDYYGDGTMRYLLQVRKNLEAERIQMSEMSVLSQHLTMSVDEETPAYVTYSVIDDNYLGGAHHSRTAYCRNISRDTNKPVDIIDSTSLPNMQPLLRENVSRCLKSSGIEDVTNSTLGSYLILSEDGMIPLPIHEPWLGHNYIWFVYQPYEIASYAVGTISFSVAVEDMMPYLTEEAKSLLN